MVGKLCVIKFTLFVLWNMQFGDVSCQIIVTSVLIV